MKYTENDITVGTKMICKDNQDVPWWKNGKIYEVQKSTVMVDAVCIIDDQGLERYLEGILARLNSKNNGIKFEIIEDEKEMTKYVEVTKLMEFTEDESVIEIGKKYKVLYPTLTGVYIYANKAHPKYFIYDNQFEYSFESNKEEKELKKYAKITKYGGLFYTDKEYGLEIGKEYEIVSFEDDYTNDCRIYLNEEHPNYFISEYQYELVEREEPTLKANVKVDTLEVIEAKIEQLANEQTKLYNKRMRIKEQEESLREKRMKLKEAKKSLEFLKKQNYL